MSPFIKENATMKYTSVNDEDPEEDREKNSGEKVSKDKLEKQLNVSGDFHILSDFFFA